MLKQMILVHVFSGAVFIIVYFLHGGNAINPAYATAQSAFWAFWALIAVGSAVVLDIIRTTHKDYKKQEINNPFIKMMNDLTKIFLPIVIISLGAIGYYLVEGWSLSNFTSKPLNVSGLVLLCLSIFLCFVDYIFSNAES